MTVPQPFQSTTRRATVTLLILFLFTALTGVATAAQHNTQNSDPGITPGSPLYGLEVALDNVRLAFTFSPESKAELGLRIAEERLAEARAMAQQNNTEGLSTAQKQYAAAVTKAQSNMQKARATAVTNTAFRTRFRQQQAALQDLEAAVEARGQAEVEQEVKQIDTSMDAFRAALHTHRNRTIQELRQEGRSDEEIRAEFREAENRTGLTTFLREKAEDRLNKASTCLQNAETREVSANRTAQFQHMVNVSRQHRLAAQAAFNAQRFGEAFGRSTASWQVCRAANAWADGASREEVRERFEDAQEDMAGEFSVSISVSCSQTLNESAVVDVEVEVEENGVEEEAEFTLQTSSCPPPRDQVVTEIASRTSLTAEEVRTYMGPGMKARAEFEFDFEDARDQFEDVRDEFEKRFRNRTAGFESRFECDSDASNEVEVNTGDDQGEIEVSARTPLNHGGYMAAADVDKDSDNQSVTVTVSWVDSGQPAIQCIGEGRADQDITVSWSGEWTVNVHILVDGSEQYSQTRTVTVQSGGT